VGPEVTPARALGAGWAGAVATPRPPTDPDVQSYRIRLVSDTGLPRDAFPSTQGQGAGSASADG
jgi:hypothetical protein